MAGNETAVHSYRIVTVSSRLRRHDHPEHSLFSALETNSRPLIRSVYCRQEDKSCWKTVFIMAASVHFVGITFYALFASGELQSWAEPTAEQQAAWENAPVKQQVNVNQAETNMVCCSIWKIYLLSFCVDLK